MAFRQSSMNVVKRISKPSLIGMSRLYMTATATPKMTIDTSNKYPIEVISRRFQKATKQLATLGPASNNVEMIEKLFLSGADVFRLNFSHYNKNFLIIIYIF
jgi:hypothetical protein